MTNEEGQEYYNETMPTEADYSCGEHQPKEPKDD